MASTAAARHAIDFQGYGLTATNLAGWLGIGVLTFVIVALVGVVIKLADCKAEDDDPSATEPAP